MKTPLSPFSSPFLSLQVKPIWEASEKMAWTRNAWTDDLHDLEIKINTFNFRNTLKKLWLEKIPDRVLLWSLEITKLYGQKVYSKLLKVILVRIKNGFQSYRSFDNKQIQLILGLIKPNVVWEKIIIKGFAKFKENTCAGVSFLLLREIHSLEL